MLGTNLGFSLRSNPGLKLANAFGVFFKLNQHQKFRFMDSLCNLWLSNYRNN